MRQAIIFDIDGTLADASHRLSFIQGNPKNWAAFFDSVPDDEPITPLVTLCGHLVMLHASATNLGVLPPFEVVFCTGRPDTHRGETEAWLRKHLPYGLLDSEKFPIRLFMRKSGDFRPDTEVKKDTIELLRATGLEPYVVFEDRKRVVDMWRQNGIMCLQVADGDY